jgi:hypothetical protein
MFIGNSLGYSSLGLGGALARTNSQSERNTVTLEAKLDPKKPNEYSVQTPTPSIVAPEQVSDNKNAAKRAPQNTDPVSRAFNAVADYESFTHRVDVRV